MIHHILTILRGFTAFFVPFLFKYEKHGILIGVFVYAIISDMLDGAIARYCGSSSHFGALLDVTADRILIYSVILGWGLSNYMDGQHFLKWISLIWIVRDIALAIFFFFGNNAFQSLLCGKIFSISQMGFALAMCAASYYGIRPCIYSQSISLIWFSVVGLLSVINYFYLFF
jgi:phosphatidylglycerophosphate synthase